MNFPQLQQACQKCITVADMAEKQRAQAFIQSNILQNIPQIIEKFVGLDDNSIFVISQIITKMQKKFNNQQCMLLMQRLLLMLSQTYKDNSLIIIGNAIAKYTEKSLYNLAAALLKRIYINYNVYFNSVQRQTFWQFINDRRLSYGLKQQLWIAFLSCIATVDPTMGYLNYRNLTNSVQQNFIGKISRYLVTQFKSTIQKVMVGFIQQDFGSLLQLQSSVPKPQYGQVGKTLLDLPIIQRIKIERMVQLLRQITEFNYNITYSQYDMERAYDNCIIGYPDGVIQQIVDGNFIKYLFFLNERLVHVQKESGDMFYKLLQIMQKVALCRLTHVTKPKKRQFRQALAIGINFLMRKVQNARFLSEIIDLNYKFIINVPVRKLKNFSIFENWLKSIARLICSYFTNISFSKSITSQLTIDILQLWRKLSIHFSDPKIKEYNYLFQDLNKNITKVLLNHILGQKQSPFKQFNFVKAKKIKKVVQSFFSVVRNIVSSSMGQLIDCFNIISTNLNTFSIIQVGQLLLLGQGIIITHQFVQKINYSGNYQNKKLMASSMASMLNIVIPYSQAPTTQPLLHDIVTLMFCQNFLLNTISRITVSNDSPASCNSSIFRQIENYLEQKHYQWWVEKYLQILLKILNRKNPKSTLYLLDILQQFLIKLKFTLRKEEFKSFNITGKLFQFLLQAAKDHFQTTNTIKMKKQLFHIIVLLGFDDLMDNYNSCLDKVLQFVWNRHNGNQLSLLYSLRGMAQNLDHSPIYRRFINKTQIYLIDSLKKAFVQKDFNISIQLLKLSSCMLQNKSYRLSNHKNQKSIYQFIRLLLNPYNQIINRMKKSIENQSTRNPQSQIKIALQLWRIWIAIFKGNYINYYMMGLLNPQLPQIILKSIIIISSMSPILQQYPKQYKTSLVFLNGIAQNMLIFILQSNLNNQQSVQAILGMIMPVLVYINQKSNQLYFSDKKVIQSDNQTQVTKQLEVLSKIIHCFFGYLSQTHQSQARRKVLFFFQKRIDFVTHMLLSLFCICFNIYNKDRLFTQACHCLSCLIVILKQRSQVILRQKMQDQFTDRALLEKLHYLHQSATDDERNNQAFKSQMKLIIKGHINQHLKLQY